MFQNLVVIELASVLAGPSVGMFFAELGAKVIKVENLRTQGDVTRQWKLPNEVPNSSLSAYFSSVNWGKQSILLDLKQPEAQSVVHRMVQQADMVISSYIPGTAQRLGVDAARLLAINPQLVCGEINGYGMDEQRAAFDAIIQAEAGFTYMNGLAPKRYKMPVALMDVLAGHQLKEAMLLAYIRRLQTGKGERVTVSLLESGIAALVNQVANYLVADKIPDAIGSDHPNIVPYGSIFHTQDKPIVLAIGNDRQFGALCEVLEIEMKDEYATNALRVQHRAEVKAVLQEKISEWRGDDLLKRLGEKRVPVGAVNDMEAVVKQPQAQAILLEDDGMRGVRSVVGTGLEVVEKLSRPPKAGEHSRQVLADFGFHPSEIEAFLKKNVLR